MGQPTWDERYDGADYVYGTEPNDFLVGQFGNLPPGRVLCLAEGEGVLFAAATVTGVILLLLRRGVGRWMVVFGAAVALLTFGSVFVAGARLAWPVYGMPLLPLASLFLALHPATRRWGDE